MPKAAPPPTGCANTPKDGSLNLKSNTTPYQFDVVPDVPYAKTTGSISVKFSEVKYEGDKYTAGCPAPENDECDDGDEDLSSLVYDVYYPVDYENYATCPLPAIILFHAGGFQECSNFRQPGIITICEELAKRGYVAFCVEYRRGRIKESEASIYTSAQQQLAAYRACQDARGAIRSIIKRQDNETTGDNWQDPYRIDKFSIFVGGMSAGGVAAMNAAWYTEDMVYDVFPSVITPTGSTIKQALGDIDLNAYYGGPSITYQENIIGTVNMWGSIGIPIGFDTDEYNFFNSSLLKPHIGFHGQDDMVFPYYDDNGQYVYFNEPPVGSGTDYNSEDFCIDDANGPYRLNGDEESADMINGSSLNMHKILDNYQINNELYLDCNMAHGLDKNCVICPGPTGPADKKRNNDGSCSSCVFDSEFGTGATNANQVSIYMAQRIAVFFQAVLVGIDQNLVNYEFVECENGRKKCETNPACGNTACNIE